MSTKAERQRLQRLLAEYRDSRKDSLDTHAYAVVDRINKDDRAATVFTKFGDDDRKAFRILDDCIKADELVRTRNKKLKAENEMEQRLNRLLEYARELRVFALEAYQTPEDRLSAWIMPDPDEMNRITASLYSLTHLIELRKRIAAETGPRLGATRKTNGKGAETAAIGWIGDSVIRIFGAQHQEATATLSEIVLECEVSIDRLRAAVKTRKAEWRQDMTEHGAKPISWTTITLPPRKKA